MPEKNYTDADLRKISTYMMGSDDFNAEEFSESVDHIMVMTDGSLKMMNERVSNPCFKSPIYFAKRERDETTGQLDAIELCKLLIAQN